MSTTRTEYGISSDGVPVKRIIQETVDMGVMSKIEGLAIAQGKIVPLGPDHWLGISQELTIMAWAMPQKVYLANTGVNTPEVSNDRPVSFFVTYHRSSAGISLDMEFPLPTNCQPLLIITMPEQRTETLSSAYYVWYDAKTSKFYVPPLPNIYSDSKLCMGEIPGPGNSPLTPYTHMARVAKAFRANPWNQDLHDSLMQRISVSSYQEIFALDANMKPLPLPENWTECLCVPATPPFTGLLEKLTPWLQDSEASQVKEQEKAIIEEIENDGC